MRNHTLKPRRWIPKVTWTGTDSQLLVAQNTEWLLKTEKFEPLLLTKRKTLAAD